MTATTSLSVFHQWLLAEPSSKTSACAIILHGGSQASTGDLIADIAQYLNEYDDDGEGRWLPASGELMEKIVTDANQRQLLGLGEFPENATPESEARATLGLLARRGHIVFHASGLPEGESGLCSTFHAGVGTAGQITEKCHLILNPELIDENCIAHIIGDVFLEWLHCEMRRGTTIQDIR